VHPTIVDDLTLVGGKGGKEKEKNPRLSKDVAASAFSEKAGARVAGGKKRRRSSSLLGANRPSPRALQKEGLSPTTLRGRRNGGGANAEKSRPAPHSNEGKNRLRRRTTQNLMVSHTKSGKGKQRWETLSILKRGDSVRGGGRIFEELRFFARKGGREDTSSSKGGPIPSSLKNFFIKHVEKKTSYPGRPFFDRS